MRFKWPASILAVLVLTVFYLYFKLPHFHSVKDPLTQKPSKVVLKDLLKTPSQLPPPKNSNLISNIEEAACVEEWTSLTALDLSDFSPTFISDLIENSKCGKLPEELAKVRAEFLNKCAHAVFENNEKPNDCMTALYLYRASITDWFYQDEDIAKIQSKKILFEKMYAMLGNNKIDPEKLAKLSDRFLEIDPHVFDVHRVSMIAHLLKVSMDQNSETTVKDQAWLELESKYESYREEMSLQNTVDNATLRKTMELGLFIKSKSFEDREALAKEAQHIIETNSQDKDIGHYLWASTLWKSGQHEEAKEQVALALKLKPDEKRYRDTLNLMENGKKKEGLFSFQLDASLNFDLQ